MRKFLQASVLPSLLLIWFALPAQAQQVQPMFGGVLIDAYDFGKDVGPKGTIRYDAAKNEFVGYYTGLKMPKGRKAIFAWLHDTVNQKTTYLGPVGWLKPGASQHEKGQFRIKAPDGYQGGNFGTNEIIGFTSEPTRFINYKNGKPQVVQKPDGPSGSQRLPQLKPAFYLFAKLPGADTQLHYCGHGRDFFYAKDLDKQSCYD